MKHWLQDNYGSRRGFVRTWLSRLLYMTGSYKPYKDVEWGSVGRLIFVCKGNICRSAYAEALVRSLGVEALSCGLNTRSDLPANDRAKEVASTRGVSLEVHRTTPIEECTPLKNDLFIAMEPWQADKLKEMYGSSYACTLLGLWCSPTTPHLQDPYGSTQKYFNQCFNRIDNSVNEILRKISKEI